MVLVSAVDMAGALWHSISDHIALARHRKRLSGHYGRPFAYGRVRSWLVPRRIALHEPLVSMADYCQLSADDR
jgi:hypothetical protein